MKKTRQNTELFQKVDFWSDLHVIELLPWQHQKCWHTFGDPHRTKEQLLKVSVA